jgi:hypothetical protein
MYVTISIEDSSDAMELDGLESYKFTRESISSLSHVTKTIINTDNNEFSDRFENMSTSYPSDSFSLESPPSQSEASESSYSPPTNESEIV